MKKPYARRKVFEASRWTPPQEMARIAHERTYDIVGTWADSLRWGHPIDPRILAESCYMQGINDAIYSLVKTGMNIVPAEPEGEIYWP